MSERTPIAGEMRGNLFYDGVEWVPIPAPKVYILSMYEEHGAYNVVATLDRDKIIPLLREKFTNLPDTLNTVAEKQELEEAVAIATELLKNPDPENGAMADLNRAWGGIQLHVVNLS